MRRFIVSLTALSLAIPAVALPSVASAQRVHYTSSGQAYTVDSRGVRHYRGQSQRYVQCRHSSGTAGLVAGGVGGALLGRSVLGHGALGTIAGGVGGALGGRAIDRTLTAKERCN